MDRDPSSARLVPSLDAWDHAHNAMTRALARDGARALSDPRQLATFLDDELAGLPRERTLLVRAVEVQVPEIIKGSVGRAGVDRAVELASATLLALHGRDPEGCTWAAGEVARLLGYPPAGPPPSAGRSAEATGRSAEATAYRQSPGPTPARPGAFQPAQPEYPDDDDYEAYHTSPILGPRTDGEPNLEARSAAVARLFEPDAGPGAGYPAHDEPERSPFFPDSRGAHSPGSQGDYAPWPDPSGVRHPGLAAPTSDRLAPPWPEEDHYEPRFKPRRARRWYLRPGSVVGGLASLVLIYFALAGIFLLPPYSRQSGDTPSATATNSAAERQQALRNDIPSAIRPGCLPNTGNPPGNPEIVASMLCAVRAPNGDTIAVVYDLFGNIGAANGAFSSDIQPGYQTWGPVAALVTTSSCDPGVDPTFNGATTYRRPSAPGVTRIDTGQVACWVSASQEPTIDWTSNNRAIGANAVIVRKASAGPPTQADKETLYGFWSVQSGPD